MRRLPTVLIRKLEALGPLSAAAWAALAEVTASPQQVRAGQDLMREGDAPVSVLVVLEGFAGRCKLLRDGRRQIPAYLVPGDTSDLDAPLLRRMDHGVIALSVCTVVHVPIATLEALLRDHPDIARALRWVGLVDAATLREWVVNVGSRSTEERVAHLFCELLARLEAVGLAKDEGFVLPLTQQVLADTVGVSAVHINRTLQHLRGEGLIRLDWRWLQILDAPRLRALAGFEPAYLHLGPETGEALRH